MRNNRDYNRPLKQSPRRQMINDELDQHTMRIKELLKADITVLEQQNSLLKTKCKKLSQLQEKVELVLRQNNQLLGQNQKMSRLLHQHKSQSQMLKNKLETQANQRVGALSQYQFKQKKLLAEIQNLNSEVRELEGIKNMQISDLKSQFHSDIQNLKRQHDSALNIYDQEIRKLKEILDQRDLQIGQLNNKIKRHISDNQYEILRGKEERQKLINQMNFMQSDHRKDIQDLKSRLDANYLQEIEQIKRNNLSQIQAIERDNARVKEILYKVQKQNQKLKDQLHKTTNYYQESLSMVKRQNDNLKLQLIELQKIGQNEKASMEDRLQAMHNQQILQLKAVNNDHLNKLQNKLLNLENANQHKENQIQQLLKQKAQARNVFDNQNNRLKDDIHILKQKYSDMQSKYTERISNLERKLNQQEKQNDRLDQLNLDMKENYQAQISSLKSIIAQKKNQLDQQVIRNKENLQQAKQKQNELQNQKNQVKENLKRQEKQRKIQVQNLQNTVENLETQLRTKLESLLAKISLIQKQNQGLKKNIVLKEKQIKSLKQRLQESQNRQKALEDQLSDSREKLLKKDKKNNQLLDQQKQRLQKSYAYTIENMKTDNEASLRLQGAKIKQLKEKLLKKQKELQKLLRMHKKMTDEVKVLSEQQANKKNIDLKFPGATADLIATKNMFDVFLKTKVLDFCGDAIEMKQNILQQEKQ